MTLATPILSKETKNIIQAEVMGNILANLQSDWKDIVRLAVEEAGVEDDFEEVISSLGLTWDGNETKMELNLSFID